MNRLLFVGIHTAWDAVTYLALERRTKPAGTQRGRARSSSERNYVVD
jgi:hypothetical protein